MDIKKIDEYALKLLKKAGDNIRKALENEMKIEEKADKDDLVTNIDKETEEFFVESIKKEFPEHKILGEEGIGEKITNLKGIVWILDPIDGTMNFIVQKRNFAISLGIFEDGVGKLGYVYDVMREQIYSAVKGNGALLNGNPIAPVNNSEKLEDTLIIAGYVETIKYYPKIIQLIEKSHGMRFLGSAALEMMEIGSGRAGAFIHKGLNPWDIAGSVVILEELGVKISRINGDEVNILEKGSLIAATANIHDNLINEL
ncbi:inositol monophosphatase family protein [Priestia aryabhattai]|uniref:inositol monophosphatase family protein n=1 Tax=Priestia aryabhattai TaxID=412384 RepID=UPI001CCC2B89|nr:inositol monophosphatase family protein [Priestia aryabhattai]MBZ6485119.1 inositol monophosphatase family protein [Priestia aryabhattai]